MTDWHEQTFGRVIAGIEQKWTEALDRHFVPPGFTEGMFEWFEKAYPEAYKKLQDADDMLNQLWLTGKTDAESQKEFNAVLRIFRNGVLWCQERFIAWKKDCIAKERADAALIGKQEALI